MVNRYKSPQVNFYRPTSRSFVREPMPPLLKPSRVNKCTFKDWEMPCLATVSKSPYDREIWSKHCSYLVATCKRSSKPFPYKPFPLKMARPFYRPFNFPYKPFNS